MAFGIAASVLVPVGLLGALEGALRLAGFGYPSHFFLSGRLNGQEVLYDNQQFGWRFFPPLAARTPRPVVFSRSKPPQTCRIFVFGESAAYGDPSPAFGLPRFLEVLLRNRYPDLHFEVVNVAMTAINSNVVLPIAKDCARQEGDVWVLYMGNNEVVGPYGAGTIFGPQVPSLAWIRASISLNASKIGQLLAKFRPALFRRKTDLTSGISLDLFLDNKLRHEDPRMEKVYAHFARNLSDIIETGARSGVKVVVSTVGTNLKDCAPFASLHRLNLNDAQLAEWNRLYQTGVNADEAGKLEKALEAYAQTAKIDDQWAELQFRQARDLWSKGDFPASISRFSLSRDYDALRVRADSRINEIIRRACSKRVEHGVAFLDGEEVLAQHSPHGVPGQELFYEHVHLNFEGNYWLARAIADQIVAGVKPPVLAGQVLTSGDWLSPEQCAAQLGLNECDRFQTLILLRQRLAGAPFTQQLNHSQQEEQIQRQIAQCRSSLSRQNMAESIQRCQQALSLSPGDWVLHQKLAQLEGQSPDKALQGRAIEEWRQVIQRVPQYAEAHYELGALLEQSGQLEPAESQLRLALRLKGNYYPRALNALGRVLAAQGRWGEAVRKYEKAIQFNPEFAEALVNLGVALNQLGQTAQARARFEQAIQLAPRDTNAVLNLAQLLDEKGEISAAITRYTEMLRSDPDNADAHYRLGWCLGSLGRSSQAQAHYLEALRIQPDFPEAHSDLGMELVKSGKEAEALEHFSEAARLDPDSALAHKNLGVALARHQRLDEAAKQFEQALRLNPGDATVQRYLQAVRHSQAGRN